MSATQQLTSQTSPLVLPSLQSIIVNREFLGLGHRLADRHRQRRQIENEAENLSSRVQYLEKQNVRAERDMKQKEETLRRMIEVRRRQSEDRMEKQKQRQQKEQQIEKARQLSYLNRMEHQLNLNQNLNDMYDQNRMLHDRGKQQKIQRQKLRSQLKSEDLSHKQDIYYMINEQKQEGVKSVIDYRRERNKESVRQYEAKMKEEQSQKLRKLSLMNELQKRQSHLIEKLRKSSQAHEAMDRKLENANKLAVSQLQKIVTASVSERAQRKQQALAATNKPTSRQSNLTEDKSETNSSRQYPLLQPIQRSRLDLESYRRKLSQISHTIDVLDKPYLLDELVMENAQSIGKIYEPVSEKKSKKRRHRKPKRYQPIEE